MFFLTFLAQPPGSWLYSFVLLAALEAPAALALQQALALRRAPTTAVPSQGAVMARLTLAAWVLFLVRGVVLLFSLLIPNDTSAALSLVPPLDRAVAAVTVLVLIWALAYPRPQAWADLALIGLSTAALLGLALEWAWWPQAVALGSTYFNGSLDDTIWVLAIGLLLAGGLWLLGQRRPPGWRAGLLLLGALLLAYGVDYLYPVAHFNTAGVTRWAEMVVVPLAMLLLYGRARGWPAEGAAKSDPAASPAAARPRPAWRPVVETLLVAGLVYFALEFATARFQVEGPSMQPSLHTGEYVLADRLAYKLGRPQRGDVVTVIPNLPGSQEFIKRLMGLPGDTIAVKNGDVWINGGIISEPYIKEPPRYVGTWQLGPDEYFVMGDNRNDSDDSHIWGSVHRSAITSKVVAVYWPLNEVALAPNYSFGGE
jgi:signal peptidase I